MAAPTPPSIDVADYLNTQGVGVLSALTGWGIFIGRDPIDPIQTITLYDQGGLDTNAKFLMDELFLQVRVRGADPGSYPVAFAKAQEVKDTLLGLANTTLNTTEYIGFWMATEITHVGNDDKERPILTQRFLVRREPSDATNREAI